MAFLDEVMVQQIGDEARDIQFRRTFLTAIASMLYAVGWIVRKAFVALWLAVTWSWAAVRLGWRDAAPTKPPKP